MRSLWIAAIIVASLSAAAAAQPAPDCDTLPNPVYLQVADTQTNLIGAVGRLLRDSTVVPPGATTAGVTLVYVTSDSCTNIEDFRTGVPVTTTMSYIPSTAEDAGWVVGDAPLICNPPGTGQPLDLANSALFVSSCTPTPPPANVVEVTGAVQAYILAVPTASSQIAITYEEAYFVFGFGTAGMVMPWVDETQMFIRAVTESALLTWAANISVPAIVWSGVREASGSDVVSALLSSASQAAIGVLGVEDYDGIAGQGSLRTTLKELAFRAQDQYAAYFCDSTSASFDKQNVRDGHYTVWSPTVWMYDVDAMGDPINPTAQWVVDLITTQPSPTPTPDFDPTVAVSSIGLVPECAMRVQKAFDGGPISLYTPSASCTCKYLNTVATTTCATCGSGSACAAGVCRDGFCEEL